ncbi:hypothetical protein SAHL_17295 [Salinisphaera orenii YIM 95161]|uniref:Uncharacterized protein n=1 Tax=Salinisphaera orenii YIM 95161 TaxID=1051139 RepID=A0A423PDG4_9GAMM|nr:hypothetical protein SAHL_17295 [Salinisphaera halophila YIM 95161]
MVDLGIVDNQASETDVNSVRLQSIYLIDCHQFGERQAYVVASTQTLDQSRELLVQKRRDKADPQRIIACFG